MKTEDGLPGAPLGEAAGGVSAAARSRAAAGVGWGSAGALYFLAYVGAIRLSFDVALLPALLSGLANTLPDMLAAPIVLRAVSRPLDRRSEWRLVALACAFATWSVLGTSAGFAAVKAWETGGAYRFSLDPRGVAWKGLMSLLVFGVLAGAGRVRFHSRQAREASARALRAETLRAESRLAVLRAQLNPHFILNVLHSLVGLAERDPRATALALERLGTTLRYVLRVQSRGTDRVLLRDELEFTREYLELERMRLGDRLDARITASEPALRRVVPPFVLQPLVENAVVHAVSPRARGGIVAVTIEETAEGLLLKVEDDGTAAADGNGVNGSGLGLGLLRDRLEALYDGKGSLELDRSPLGGYRASVRLSGEPLAREEEAG